MSGLSRISAQVARLHSPGYVPVTIHWPGLPQVRGNSGFPFRRGERWFSEFRDGGPGWDCQRHDWDAMAFRVNVLVDMFIPKRPDRLLAIAHGVLAIVDRDT